MRIVRTALLCLVVFVIGAEASSYLAGSVMPLRDRSGNCIAADQDVAGRTLGTWTPRNGRCELRDWRIWHPFGG